MPHAAFPNDTPALQISHLSHHFDRHAVLQDITLSIAQGTIGGLVGLNGMGKTTLIKIIIDLLHCQTGSIAIFGTPHSQPLSRRHLCYLPERCMPSSHLKGSEFLEIALSYYRTPATRNEIEEYAALLDFDPAALSLYIRHYSKGMGQKLGLLASFLANVPLLILDEPMSGLDPRARIHLRNSFTHYRAQGGTLFFTSHLLSDMDLLCDHVSMLHEGRIIANGTPAALCSSFATDTIETAFLTAITPR